MQRVNEDQVNKIVIKKKSKPIPPAQTSPDTHSQSKLNLTNLQLASQSTHVNETSADKLQHHPVSSHTPPTALLQQERQQSVSQINPRQHSNKRAADDGIFKLPAVKRPHHNDQPKNVLTMLNSAYTKASWALVSLDDLMEGEEIEEAKGSIPEEGEYPRSRSYLAKLQQTRPDQRSTNPNENPERVQNRSDRPDANVTREYSGDMPRFKDVLNDCNDSGRINDLTGSKYQFMALPPFQPFEPYSDSSGPILQEQLRRFQLSASSPGTMAPQSSLQHANSISSNLGENSMNFITATTPTPSSLRSSSPASLMSPAAIAAHVAASLGLPTGQRPFNQPSTTYHSKIQPVEWSFLEDAKLLATLRSVGVPGSKAGVAWDDIAKQVGVKSAAACQFRYHSRMNSRTDPT